MIAGVIRMAAVVASVLVLIGFVLFAIDKLTESSERQQRAIDPTVQVDPSDRGEARRERSSDRFREFVNDADDILLKPFAGVVDSNEEWVERGVPTALALLVYGFGLGLVANAAKRLP